MPAGSRSEHVSKLASAQALRRPGSWAAFTDIISHTFALDVLLLISWHVLN